MSEKNRPLWAPWRMEFIRGPKPGGCFLCAQQINGKDSVFAAEEEEMIVARYEHCFVILNRYPYNTGHLLIAPYRHTGNIGELTPEERHELIDVLPIALRVLKKVTNADNFNSGFNFGVAAGAGVADHLHLHVVPRFVGDTNFMPVLSDTRCVPEALRATAELLRAAWIES